MPVDVRIVDAPPNWLTWASAAASTIAVIFAVGAIWQASRQAAKAHQALLRERQAEFRLDLLKELADLAIQSFPRYPLMQIRVRMLPAELLRLTRAALDLHLHRGR